MKQYEEATGNTVMDPPPPPTREWKAKALTDFETGSEPDVLFFFTNADAEPFISAGKNWWISPPSAGPIPLRLNMKDSMMAAADGKNYAVPSSGFWERHVSPTPLSWTPAAWPSPVPTTPGRRSSWTCQTIKDAGYTPIASPLRGAPLLV